MFTTRCASFGKASPGPEPNYPRTFAPEDDMALNELLSGMKGNGTLNGALGGVAGGALASAFTNKKSARTLLKTGILFGTVAATSSLAVLAPKPVCNLIFFCIYKQIEFFT